MIKDRNILSHIYKEKEFDAISERLPGHLKTMIKVIDILESKKQSH